jgi:hypothetical protein
MGEAAALEKDGVERDLQELLAERPDALGESSGSSGASGRPTSARSTSCAATPTTAGSRSRSRRVATIEAVEQLSRYLERIRLDPARALCRGVLARAARQAAGGHARGGARASAASRSTSSCCAAGESPS